MQRAIESPATDNQTYHIGSSVEITVQGLLEIMFRIAQWHPEHFDIKPTPPNSTPRDILDISKIKRDTGWEANTSLEEGLKKTIAWYRAHPQKT